MDDIYTLWAAHDDRQHREAEEFAGEWDDFMLDFYGSNDREAINNAPLMFVRKPHPTPPRVIVAASADYTPNNILMFAASMKGGILA